MRGAWSLLVVLVVAVPAYAFEPGDEEVCNFGFCKAIEVPGAQGGPAPVSAPADLSGPTPEESLYDFGVALMCFLSDLVLGTSACDESPAEPTPSPETAAERAFTKVSLPRPGIHLRPPYYGITQYPTTATLSGLTEVTDEDPFGGGTLFLRAVPVAYWVGFGEGEPQQGGQTTHVWQKPGCYLVRAAASYRGEWSLDGETWYEIGARETRAEFEYPVTEIRAVLVNEDDPPPQPTPEEVRGRVCARERDRRSTPWP